MHQTEFYTFNQSCDSKRVSTSQTRNSTRLCLCVHPTGVVLHLVHTFLYILLIILLRI